MPWNERDFPNTFNNMTSTVRSKAIEIGNELLDQYDEPRAIRIATAQAKEWAARRHIQIWAHGGPGTTAQHVLPHERGWAVRAEGSSRATKVFQRKQDAIDRARGIATNHETHVVIHAADGKISDVIRP